MSYFLHELGHAFVFSGWMNGTTGELPATYMSPFDELVQFDSSNFFFVGANAQARYGGQIPVTYGNPFHLGNNSPRPGADLLPDLMNGVVNLYQVRYRISTLDLAIAKDCGLPLLSPSKLLNISTRLPVQRGDDALIGGFIITGSEAKRVIIRAIGPSLGGQGVSGALRDPTLELFDSAGASIANNDDWKEDQQAEIEASTIPPANDAESAIVRTLQPGSYTAVVRGANDTTGIGLVEVYDLTPAAQAKLANISSRGFVATGEDVMIGGFIVGAGGMGGTTVVVRAIGPSLQPNIPNALNDPILDLRDSNGSLLASNDNWKDSQQRQIQSTGIPPSHDREAAVLETLGAGSYTAVVRGKNAATGLGVVEVYNLD